jgi:prepilin-type N-terminal cleavage/methylation domain-containing protein
MAIGDRSLRRGFTLLEMIVAMTIGAVLLGIAVSVIALLMGVEHSGREQLHQDAVTARLAQQFRDDVHAATRLAPAEAGKKGLWQLVLAPDRTVTYHLLPEVVKRDEAVAGKPARHESYTLPAGWSARLIAPAKDQPPLASLIVVPLGALKDRDVRIDAVVGRDHRFTTSPRGSR